MHIMTALCYWTVEQWLTICKQELCIPHLGEPHEIENKWEIKRPNESVFVQNMRDKSEMVLTAIKQRSR